eukprot:7859831-Ditylum_brightwellii.AAC.1
MMSKLIICVALLRRLYLRGAAAGCTLFSTGVGGSISSSSKGMRAGILVGTLAGSLQGMRAGLLVGTLAGLLQGMRDG